MPQLLATKKPYLAAICAAAVLFFVCGVQVAYADTASENAFNQGVQDLLWNVVANVFGWIVGIGGVVFNYAVDEYIVGFGDLFISGGVGGAVDRVWSGVRDIFNLTFIFALVYLGFKMILNSDDAGTRKWLANIIMAALLVNFSLFITKFIVDFSNILAIQVLGAFPVANDGVSGVFMQIMGVSGVWGWKSTQLGDGGYMYIFGSAIIFLVTAFSFFTAGIMIMIRFIALCLYMTMSPLMFLGWVLPQFQSVSRDYWSGFLKRAFYAPVYVLMLYFSFMILAALTNVQGVTNFGDALNASDQASSASRAVETSIVSFILGIGFMLASIQVASKMSADGASTVMQVGRNISNRAKRTAQNAAYGTGRFAVRNTAGYGTQAIGAGAERARKSLDRGLANMGQKGAVSRFAARTLDRSVGAGLRATEGATIAGAETVAQKRKRVAEQQQRFNNTAKETDRANKFNEQRSIVEQNQAIIANTNSSEEEKAVAHQALEEAQKVLAGVIGKMSQDELLSLSEGADSSGTSKTGVDYILSDPNVAAHLTDEQMKALGSSGFATNTQMKALGGAREDGVINSLESALSNTAADANKLGDAFDNLSDTVKKMSNDRVLGLGEKHLTNTRIAANLTKNQMDALYASGKYTPDQMSAIETARKTGLEQIARDGALHVPDGTGGNRKATPAFNDQLGTNAEQVANFEDNRRRKLLSQSTKESGALPINIFTDPKMAEYITPQSLEQRMRDDFVSANDLDRVRANIDAHLASLTGDKQTRAQKLWRTWSNRTTYGAQLGLQNIGSDNDNQSSTQNTQTSSTPPQNSQVILPGQPGWNGGNAGPRP